MRLFVLITLVFLSLPEVRSQSLCLKLDSINCYFIPWMSRARFDISYLELLNKNSFPNFKTTIKLSDFYVLNSFINSEFLDSTSFRQADKNQSFVDVDARMVLELCLENGNVNYIVFDRYTNYMFGKKHYRANIKLRLWLNEYVLKKQEIKFFSTETANTLKIKNNYLLETIGG